MASVTPKAMLHRNNLLYIALVVILVNFYYIWSRYPRLRHPFDENPVRDDFPDSTSAVKSHGLPKPAPAPTDANGYLNYPSGYLDGAADIVFVIKTGATEVFKRLPVHFVTTLTQAPNFLIFSDHEQQIAQYKIQDALDQISNQTMSGNKDFELYESQKAAIGLGQSPEYLQLDGGWNLDKYKNIHMTKKSWDQKPHAKWYYFMDTDSYVMLSNLLPYLRDLDHTKKLYMGDVYEINNLKFAQGGTGYVISQGAMQYVLEKEPDMPHNYEKMVTESCCGDYVLGEVMRSHGIFLSELYPNFCGEGAGRIGFLAKNHCQPVVTMHHMLSAEISAMWEFERRFARPGRYILFQDIFDHFVFPNLVNVRDAWDGMSPIHGWKVDLPSDIFESGGAELSKAERKEKVWEFCGKTCKEKKEDECMQFQIQNEECRNYDGIAYGYQIPMSKEDRDEYRSGWLLDRINKIKAIECEQPKKSWPKDVIPGS